MYLTNLGKLLKHISASKYIMTGYTCERCLKEFAQKSHYNTHMKRKTPCQNNKEKIKQEVEKQVHPEVQNVIVEETKNKETLKNKIETMVKNNDIFQCALEYSSRTHTIQISSNPGNTHRQLFANIQGRHLYY